STLTGIVADEGAELVDIGQSTLHGYLTLSAIVKIPTGSDALKKMLFAVGHLGLRLEVSSLEKANLHPSLATSLSGGSVESLSVSLLGSLKDGQAIAKTTRFLADHAINIRDIKTLSQGQLAGIELTVDTEAGK